MVATFAINPFTTANGLGSFGITWDGFIQGTALDNPAVRYQLAGGYLASTETLPMWGGVGIAESIVSPGSVTLQQQPIGSSITRATTITTALAGTLAGFSVFDQDHSMVNFPQSPVPLAASGGEVNFYRLGSLARIAVACDPNLVNIEGDPTTQQVSWDFVNQQLIPYSSTTIISETGYVSGTGVITLGTAAAHGLLPGDQVIISGATGTGSFAAINGQFTLLAGTTGSTLVFNIGTGLTLTVTGGTVASGGILPCKILDFNFGNSMTVSYASGTGYATWNRAGSCAIILI